MLVFFFVIREIFDLKVLISIIVSQSVSYEFSAPCLSFLVRGLPPFFLTLVFTAHLLPLHHNYNFDFIPPSTLKTHILPCSFHVDF